METATITHAEPPLRLYRTAERVTAAAPVPGLRPEDITVMVTSDARLVIEGSLCNPPAPECGELKSPSKDVLMDEWRPGAFRREVALPTAVDAAHAHVSHGNGVLVVALPIAARTTPATLHLAPGRHEPVAREARADVARRLAAVTAGAVVLAGAAAAGVRALRSPTTRNLLTSRLARDLFGRLGARAAR